MRQPQAMKVLPFELWSGVAEASWCLRIEQGSGACFLSRIDTKRDRIAVEKTCRGNVLFQLCSGFVRAVSKRFREKQRSQRFSKFKSGNPGISIPECWSCCRRQRDGVLAVRSPEPFGRRNLQRVSAIRPWLRRRFLIIGGPRSVPNTS